MNRPMLDEETDKALFEIEQDLADIEESLVDVHLSGLMAEPKVVAARIRDVLDKVIMQQNEMRELGD